MFNKHTHAHIGMRDTITHEMIDTVQKILKEAKYDYDKFEVSIHDTGKVSPCSITQALFPEIIDLALEHLKRKASISLVEWISEDDIQKPSNIDYVKVNDKHEFKLKNKPLPLFDWSIVSK